MKTIFRVLSIIIITAIVINAQQTNFVSNVSKRGTTAAPFLNIAQGARATAMGSAFVSIADDPSAIFWNVAGLARLGQNGVIFDHTSWIADLKYNFVAGNLDLGDFGAVGFSFIQSDYGEMKVTTIAEPNGTGEFFSVSDIAVSVAWAFNITDNFSIGFNPKVIYQGIWNTSGTAFAIDMGVLYDTPFDGFTLGMSITNFGTKMGIEGTTAVVLHDPDDATTGNNGRIPAELSTDNWDLPLGFKVGLSYTANLGEVHDLVLAADASHPNNDYESVNVGGEYVFDNMFFVRGGYKSLFLDDSEESFTLGAGIQQYLMGNISVRFDYAYSDFGRFSDIQKFSVSINF
ncbi:MAG: PorV/PorQ family protein [Melioribacteraceae bacterium]|nr:PorV/PorQ family protein [Melioribacteraceae bacterium]MCF8266181.1 PorV/PorQ family protein [Melioribacteraceae bacterium]MCF8413423.1 PorV/PorQ family protein [Melioribacteraceae bacterium]